MAFGLQQAFQHPAAGTGIVRIDSSIRRPVGSLPAPGDHADVARTIRAPPLFSFPEPVPPSGQRLGEGADAGGGAARAR